MTALCTSDFHIEETPPPFRSNEPDWWSAMQRPIDQIKALQKQYRCPILFAGDLYNKWKVPPEVISWSLRHLPTMYAVPGQHDLPYHRYADVKQSGYWTMVEAGRLIDLKPGEPHPVSEDIAVYGFPWGCEVTPPTNKPIAGFTVALVHAYCWVQKACYPGAPPERRAGEWVKRLRGYDFGVFGDNHKSHLYTADGVQVVNNGAVMRRKSDESDYRPRVYLLWSDGQVSAEYLDTSRDVQNEAAVEEIVKDAVDAGDLLKAVRELKATGIDFWDTLKRLMETLGIKDGVREKVMKSCEEKK